MYVWLSNDQLLDWRKKKNITSFTSVWMLQVAIEYTFAWINWYLCDFRYPGSKTRIESMHFLLKMGICQRLATCQFTRGPFGFSWCKWKRSQGFHPKWFFPRRIPWYGIKFHTLVDFHLANFHLALVEVARRKAVGQKASSFYVPNGWGPIKWWDSIGSQLHPPPEV